MRGGGFEDIHLMGERIERTQQISVAFLPVRHHGAFPAEKLGGESSPGEVRPELVCGLVQRLIARTVRATHRCHQE